MFKILYANKDNTITNATLNGSSPKTGSNQGKSEVLDLFVLAAQSGSSYGISRILMQFDLASLSQSIVDGDVPSSGVQYMMRLIDAPHAETLPSSFDVEVYPLSRSWDEGVGLSNFDEDLKDAGYSNWDNATSLVSWTLTGSDYISNEVSASQHFDAGEEDLYVDLTNVVYAWLTGGLDNNGVVIKYLDAHETGSNNFFVKKFFSSQAHVLDRHPRLEARWSDVKQDDRGNIKYGVSGSLFYYRIINGFGENVGGNLYVDIFDSGSNVVQTLTSSLNEKGVYEASGVFINHTSSTQIYRDVWFTDSEQIFTGNFSPTFASGAACINCDEINVSLSNLKNEYMKGDRMFVRAFARPKDYRPAIRKSGSTEPSPTFLKESYYEIVNEKTNKVLVPFSTGSIKFSKLSYDSSGNYFEFDTSNLLPGNMYRIRILANFNKQSFVFDKKNWVIKVS